MIRLREVTLTGFLTFTPVIPLEPLGVDEVVGKQPLRLRKLALLFLQVKLTLA
ncbi:MAG: hypothetical protein AAGU32_10115 [Bacillota bacterium]